MSKKPKVGMWSGLTAVTAVLTAGAIVGTTVAFHYTTTVNNYLDADTYKIIRGDSDEDTEYFKSDFTSDEERESYEAELCAQVEAEGAALLKNDNNALPLASGAKVSLFGHGSVDLMYGGTGSGSVDTSKAPNFKQALEDQGIQVNSTLWDLYSSDDMMKNYSRITPALLTTAMLLSSCSPVPAARALTCPAAKTAPMIPGSKARRATVTTWPCPLKKRNCSRT